MVERANVLSIQKCGIPPSAKIGDIIQCTDEDERVGHCVDILIKEINNVYDSCAVLTSDASYGGSARSLNG